MRFSFFSNFFSTFLLKDLFADFDAYTQREKIDQALAMDLAKLQQDFVNSFTQIEQEYERK
jgi:hypothetical protein